MSAKRLRGAIAPLKDCQYSSSRVVHIKSKSKAVTKPKPALPTEIRLARLPQPATDLPQAQERNDAKRGRIKVTQYSYSETQWTERIQWDDATKTKGYEKDVKPWHLGENNKPINTRGNVPFWLPYRWEEVIAAAKASNANGLLAVEGEKCVEVARQIGLAAITPQGAWSNADIKNLFEQAKEAGLTLIFLRDNDTPGKNKADKLQKIGDEADAPCLVINPLNIWQNLVEGGDIVEILAEMEVPEFIERLEVEIQAAVAARSGSNKLNDPDEHLKLDLRTLSSESDPIKRMRLRSEIASHYRLKNSDIEEGLKHLEELTTKPQKNFFTFDEFFNEGSEAIEWVIPQLLPRGEAALLASQAKCGKTNLTTDILYAGSCRNPDTVGEIVLNIKTGNSQCITWKRGLHSTA